MNFKSLRLFQLNLRLDFVFLISVLPKNISLGLVHEVCNSFGCWEALVLELEWVVVESLVIFEMILLSLEEFVDLYQPRGILRLSLWLWSVVAVILRVREIFRSVVHVLASVNVEVFFLLVMDVEKILFNIFLVFSHVSTHHWSVH